MQSDPNNVTQHEHGLIRVYALDIPRDDIDAFARDHRPRNAQGQVTSDDPWPLLDALNATSLDASHIEAFDLSDLDGVGLASYLTEGNGVAEQDVEPYVDLLESLSGPVIIVLSRAFGGQEQTLAPEAPLRYVATFRQEGTRVSFEPLPNPDPESVLEDPPQKKRPSDAAMSGRVATIALLVMALLVWLMIRIAG